MRSMVIILVTGLLATLRMLGLFHLFDLNSKTVRRFKMSGRLSEAEACGDGAHGKKGQLTCILRV